MDRFGFEARTDNLVLVDPGLSRLTWIPRDLWCETLRTRINRVYGRGGHDLLVSALREHGLRASGSLVLSREATEAALADAKVIVPVPCRMAFSYPLTPRARIEDGSKEVVFNPPAEVLRGERIHQWVGARGTDLHRIERQKILVRRLLETRFDFRKALACSAWYRIVGTECLTDLAQVRSTWQFETFDSLTPETIEGQMVLVRRSAARPDRHTDAGTR
jgi:anionic cell wall polymer biosynthesis LytR-Cps2A-Psr (LCP) family protein